MNEGAYKTSVIKKLEKIFPGCEILKSDPSHKQGVPDLIILWGLCWASLEFKKSATASRRPNQDYFIRKLDDMSFAAYIYPENEEEILCALEQAFKSSGRTCVSESQPVSLDSLYS